MPKRNAVDDLLNDAVRGTENELFADATSTEEPDDSEDRSLEDMDGDAEGDEPDDGDQGTVGDDDEETEGEEGEGKDDEKPEAKADEKAEPEGDKPGERKGNPTVAVREERERRRAAEGERDKLKGDMDALRRDLDELRRTSTAKPAEQPKAVERPDPIVDPDGYDRWLLERNDARLVERRVEETFADAHEQHGERFKAAYEALTGLDPRNPQDVAAVRAISRAPNPGRALMKWHGEREIAREIGGDPAAYKQRLRDELLKDHEVRKQVLADLRREANGGGAPRNGNGQNTITRLPSLNSASGNTGRAAPRRGEPVDDSDGAVFDDVTSGMAQEPAAHPRKGT